ncbi:MAG: fatty acid desaturase [bacterium]|nr:fatty acid desaturase [bacterium]
MRSHKTLLYFSTFSMAAILYFGIALAMQSFRLGHYWVIFPAGLLAHSFFVITMHDGAHKSITKTKFDYFIMNFCAGLIILPLYTELFKKYHLLHHANTNTEDDPLWSDLKNKLFEEKRLLYAILQCLPFAFNLALILGYKEKKSDKSKKVKVSIPYVILSFVVAGLVSYLTQPPLWFVLGTFTVMTSLGAIRYWGEHMGVHEGKESNTHWFPLGMGIGNHEVHHDYPGYSWLTLTIGLLFRKLNTDPFRSVYGMFFDKRYKHYRAGK